jgi:hypothetical protein
MMMFRRIARLFLIGAAVFGLQGVIAGTAWAHFPTITASTSCVNGAPVISYTSVSWAPGQVGGSNPEIDITFNGVKVDAQPYLASTTPPDQFSGQKPAPAGAGTVVVDAVAVGIWDDGFHNGENSGNPVTLTIPTSCAPLLGRFTGGGKDVVVGVVTVTQGLEIDCDLANPNNNLEINWGGNHFHTESITAVVCFWDPTVNPKQPKTLINTMVGKGIGRYNGVEGYTVEFTFVDDGEPGRNDRIALKIYETANPTNVVLSVPIQFLTDGNLQAHLDQR